MSSQLPNVKILYRALIDRDPAFDGVAYVAVHSTGIFCRLTCAARKPKFENCTFFESARLCLVAGFRPCKRCRPLTPTGDVHPMIQVLMDALTNAPNYRWREQDLIELGFDPSTVRRVFKQHFGFTFLEVCRRTRLQFGSEVMMTGGKVIDAQFDAGFESSSGFQEAFSRLAKRPPSAITGHEMLKADWIKTPIGPMIAVCDADNLHLLEFMDRRGLPTELEKLSRRIDSPIGFGRYLPTERIEREIQAYFAGITAAFTTPMALFGSEFSKRVWSALTDIPAGETRSYKQIAAALECPASVRPVARANGANQIALAIPCHRVVGADGALTGYGGGLWRKRWLIEHERQSFLTAN